MIVTLTANTTLDQTVFVAPFTKNTTMRATGTVLSMGGKPTDASFILGEIGIASHALGMAAGPLGITASAMLQARGVTTDFVEINGSTRLNVVIVDTQDGTTSTITTNTLEATSAHTEQLLAKYRLALATASVVVTGGTLPAGVPASFYATVIEMAHQQKVPIIFDAAEPNLSVGLAARPSFVKPNRHELAGLVGYPIDSLAAAYRAGRELVERFGTIPVITLDSAGGICVLPDRAYYIPPIPVDVVSPAGCGDAVLAGLAASVFRKQPLEEGLRLGFAAATAVLLMPGTADCRRADVERFLNQVELQPYSG